MRNSNNNFGTKIAAISTLALGFASHADANPGLDYNSDGYLEDIKAQQNHTINDYVSSQASVNIAERIRELKANLNKNVNPHQTLEQIYLNDPVRVLTDHGIDSASQLKILLSDRFIVSASRPSSLDDWCLCTNCCGQTCGITNKK